MRALLAVFALGLCACDAIREPPTSPAPVNSCTGSCSSLGYPAGASCLTVGSGLGACQSTTIGPFVLVVTVPTLAPAEAGTTYAITDDDLFADRAPAALNVCGILPAGVPALGHCYALEPPSTNQGFYLVNAEQALEADRPVGLAANADPFLFVTLPASTTFWPVWQPPGAATAIDARYLGLPLPPVLAEYTTVPNLDLMPGGQGTAVGWSAFLPPLPPAGGYTGIVNVMAPFAGGFPDLTYAPSSNTSVELGGIVNVNGRQVVGAIVPIPPGGLTVERADGSPLGRGWSVYFRDPATLNVTSSRATLTDTQTLARLNVFNPTPMVVSDAEFATLFAEQNASLVVEPPTGAIGLPTIVEGVTGNSVVKYPALPPVVHVAGKVTSPRGNGISATVLFYSYQLDDVVTCESPSISMPGETLGGRIYETTTATADLLSREGEVGAFTVDLPQGYYTYVVQPTVASGAAKSTHELIQIALPTPVCSGASPSLDGVVLTSNDLVTVTGSFITADGRPLASAEVILSPAGALAGRLRPNSGVPLAPIARATWPRPFTTTTSVDGSFRVDVDQGEYDMTVHPEPGTNFPWVVSPDLLVGDAGRTLEPVIVPVPFFLAVTLEDHTKQPLRNAVVQAYSFWNGFALPIGAAMTDANGQFTMMLTTSFPNN